jgi:hypothetical protein
MMEMTVSVPVLLNLPLMAFAWYVGGWPWAAIGLMATLVASRQESNRAALIVSAIALFWILAFWWIGDRRFFFPYTMLLTVFASMIPLRTWVRALAAAGILEVFLSIRMWQDASREVLLFEAVVAVAIAAVALVIGSTNDIRNHRVWLAIAGSLLAYLSLAL